VHDQTVLVMVASLSSGPKLTGRQPSLRENRAASCETDHDEREEVILSTHLTQPPYDSIPSQGY
jgi:hypothetical protein